MPNRDIFNYDDHEDEQADIPAPQSLNRETVDPWFVLEENERESKLNSKEAKSAAKQIVPIIVSVGLLGLLVYGGFLLANFISSTIGIM